MRAHVVALLPALLETLSVIEDPALNYLQMHSESAGIAEGALEAARLTAMRSSDATVAIDACLRVMDAEQLQIYRCASPVQKHRWAAGSHYHISRRTRHELQAHMCMSPF